MLDPKTSMFPDAAPKQTAAKSLLALMCAVAIAIGILWTIMAYLDTRLFRDLEGALPFVLSGIAFTFVVTGGYICQREWLPAFVRISAFYFIWCGIAIAFGAAGIAAWQAVF